MLTSRNTLKINLTRTTRLGDLGQGETMAAPPERGAEQARAAIQAALGQIGFTLPGSITIRRTRCGKPRCACKADPPALHGPYIQWTRTVNGKTVTRTLTQAQYETYASWLANARRLRALAAQLEALSLREIESPRVLWRLPIHGRVGRWEQHGSIRTSCVTGRSGWCWTWSRIRTPA